MNKESAKRILKETPEIYNQIAEDFSDTRGKWWQGFGDFAKYVKDGGKVLDVGCGNGRMAQIFAGKKIEYLGLDNSKELIQIAQERYASQPDYKFAVADALALELPEAGFDLILMIAVLHHIPTRQGRQKIINDLYRALKPGGHVVISNWNLFKIGGRKKFRYFPYLFDWRFKASRGVRGLADAFVPWKADLPKADWQARYIHSFGRREMARLMKSAGFKIESNYFYSKSRGRTNIFSGDNLLTIAKK